MKLNDILFNTFVKKIVMRFSLVIIVLLNALLLVNCSSILIFPINQPVENNNNTPKLNIFVPRKSKAEQSQVLIFCTWRKLE
jgi:hypothetical protein